MQITCPPFGPAPAKIMIVGDFPGEQEILQQMPFAGTAGQELSRMLMDAGIHRGECFLTNVARIRPPENDISMFVARRKSDITPKHALVRDKYCLPPIWEGIAQLSREIEMVQPDIILALGDTACWALTGKSGITSWRGSMLKTDLPLALDYAPKVIPTYHPSAVFRQWSWRPIAVHDMKRVKKEVGSKDYQNRGDYKFLIRPNYGIVMAVLDKLQREADAGNLPLSIDIETRSGHIACIGIAWSKREALCIPLMCVERKEGYWTFEEELGIYQALRRLLTSAKCEGIGQNFLYDAQYFLRHMHYSPNLVQDTMLSQHSCFSNMPKGLDFLSSLYCEHHVFWKDDGKTWDEKTGEDQLWWYNCEDAARTFEIAFEERTVVKSMGLAPVHEFQQQLFWPVLKSMHRGIRVDHQKKGAMALEILEAIDERNAWLYNVIGYELNIKSPKQMKELFYDELRQRPVISRKTGSVTCDDEALLKIAEREPLLRPVIQKIQELRSLGVFYSTFIQAPVDVDGRMRCSFNIGGTETYRFSSSTNAFGSGLNFQNIPSGGAAGQLKLPNVRTLFIPDPGNTFFDIDLSSADLRIVVWEADEPEMKRMLREGLDPYTEVAKEFYHDPGLTKKDPRRQLFKAFCHGTNYLGSAKGLAERLGLLVHEAEKTQKWYFGKFPKIKRWQDDLKDQVFKRKMVENVFGYRCYFFDRIEGTIFNQAAAWIPQSTVACLINRAYLKIYETLPHVEVLLQVHDSLAGQFPSHYGEAAVRQIVQAAEIPLPYSDPLIIPVGVKTSTISWGDCA